MSTRIELFEHETVRVGQALRAVDGGEVRFTPTVFDSLVRYNDAAGGHLFQVGHQRITTTQHVGYLEVGNLAIEILPKADRATPHATDARVWRDGLLDMLRVATGLRFQMPSAASQHTGRTTLLELVAARFLQEVERLLHEGLAKGYRDEEANGPTFRGRLLVQQNLRENLVRRDRFYVRFATYDRDILVNRILGAALDALSGLALSTGLAARATAARAVLPELTALRVTPQHFERLLLGRPTARYVDALAMARLLLERRAPHLRAGHAPVFALLFDMNVLWERYVAALFRRAATSGVRVSTQESRRFWKVQAQPSRTIRPDIVVRSGDTVLFVVDTKWKVVPDGAPGDPDLKQMFAYNELFGSRRALLIYPCVGKSGGRVGTFADRVHGCDTVQLGLFGEQGWNREAMLLQVRGLLSAPPFTQGGRKESGSGVSEEV